MLLTSLAADRLRCKLQVFRNLARSLADLSRCKRSKIGCVIAPVELTEVLAIGYNGPPSGEDNDSCRGVEGACGCIHAEANALVKLRGGDSGLLLVTSLSPCEHCAGLIVNSNRVRYVIYEGLYRDSAGLSLLQRRGLVLVRGETACQLHAKEGM